VETGLPPALIEDHKEHQTDRDKQPSQPNRQSLLKGVDVPAGSPPSQAPTGEPDFRLGLLAHHFPAETILDTQASARVGYVRPVYQHLQCWQAVFRHGSEDRLGDRPRAADQAHDDLQPVQHLLPVLADPDQHRQLPQDRHLVLLLPIAI
jgi:hypothetical protein